MDILVEVGNSDFSGYKTVIEASGFGAPHNKLLKQECHQSAIELFSMAASIEAFEAYAIVNENVVLLDRTKWSAIVNKEKDIPIREVCTILIKPCVKYLLKGRAR